MTAPLTVTVSDASPEDYDFLTPEQRVSLTPAEAAALAAFEAQARSRGVMSRRGKAPPPPAPAAPLDPLEHAIRNLTPEQRARTWTEREIDALGFEEYRAHAAEIAAAARDGRIVPRGSSLSPAQREAAEAATAPPELLESEINAMTYAERKARDAEIVAAFREGRVVSVEEERRRALASR